VVFPILVVDRDPDLHLPFRVQAQGFATAQVEIQKSKNDKNSKNTLHNEAPGLYDIATEVPENEALHTLGS